MHTMTLNELVAHTHSFEAGIPLITGGAAGRDVTGNKTSFETGATGNSQPFNIMQPSVVFNYFIKY
jgi:microcystin-dependent protein